MAAGSSAEVRAAADDDGWGEVYRGGGRGSSARAHRTGRRGGGGRGGGGRGRGGRGGGGGRRGRPAGGGGWRRRSKIVLTGVLALLLVAVVSAGALLWYGRSNIDQRAIEGISPRKGRTVTLSGGDQIEIMNVLLVGVDNPGSLSEEQRARVAPDGRSGRRPDVVILAQLEVGGRGAALLSFPRDLRVELCDGSVDKLNASFAAGERVGTEPESCLVKTITGLTGVEIDHYVEVDFGGFMRVMESLGGVTMYLEEPMIDRKAHLDVPAGCVTLTPEQALGFVRSRGYDDDFGRIARQQRFLKETIEEARRIGVVTNPARLFALVDRASGAVRTDDGLGLGEMRDLAFGLRNMTSSQVVARTVPGEPTRIGGVSYVVAQTEEAQRLYASFRDGSVLAGVQSPQEAPTVAATDPPAGVEAAQLPPVVVLNASGVDGLAARTSELLEASGVRVAEVGNATTATERTEIAHGTGLEAHAQLLAELVGQGEVVERGGGAPLTLVLGSDYDLEAAEALLAGATAAFAETEASPSPRPSPHDGDGGGADGGGADGGGGGADGGGGGATAGDGESTAEPEAGEDGTPEASPPEPSPTPEFRNTRRPEDVDC